MIKYPEGKFTIGKRFFEQVTKNDRIGYYPVDGENLVNITTVLDIRSKPALRAWYAKKALETGDAKGGEKEALKAARRGGNLHNYFENDLSGVKLPELTEEEEGFLPAWETFKSNHDLKFIDAERPVCHLKYKYAGRTDLVTEIDGIPCIADYKTVGDAKKLSYPPYDTQRFQLEAYRRAWHWMGGGWIDGVALIRIAPNGKHDFRLWNSRDDMDESNNSFGGFVNCLNLWRSCNEYSKNNPLPVWMRSKKAVTKS